MMEKLTQSEMAGSLVAEQIVEVFRANGVEAIFALAGASQSRLLDECERAGIEIVSTRHETATVGAADGYARIAGGLGVALVNVDQGMPNAITGIQSAFEACIPVLVLVGREPDSQTEPELPVDHDELALVRPISKWARTVRQPERLAEYIEAGARRAMAGRPGPVVIAYPKDFLGKNTLRTLTEKRTSAAVRPGPSSTAIDRAAELLRNAKRPLAIAGSGAMLSRCAPQLRALKELGVPVAQNAMGRGLLSETGGGAFAWPVAQSHAREADLVIWIGARMAKRFGYGLEPRFARDAVFIQIDIDAEEIGRNRPVDVGIHSDASLALDALLEKLGRQPLPLADGEWLNKALKDKIARINASGREEVDMHVDVRQIGRVVMDVLPEESILVSDGACILGRMFATYQARHPYSYIDTYPLGSMGMGTPMALGAAVAERILAKHEGRQRRRTVLVTGDGSLGFYLAELASFALAGIDPIIIVSNNGGWGNEIHAQPHRIGRCVNAHFGQVDHAMIARACGCNGRAVSNLEDFRAALKSALGESNGYLVDVRTQEDGIEPFEQTIDYTDLTQSRIQHFDGSDS